MSMRSPRTACGSSFPTTNAFSPERFVTSSWATATCCGSAR
ncbi:hypothetical protein [Lysobacter gummosus]